MLMVGTMLTAGTALLTGRLTAPVLGGVEPKLVELRQHCGGGLLARGSAGQCHE
jgi:hypothetical protein